MRRKVRKLTKPKRAALIAAARSLLTANPKEPGKAVTFRHQGRTLRGMDCIGLLVWSFNAIGFSLDDRTDYGMLPAKRKLAESLTQHFGPPVAGDLQPGDVVTMAWGAEESHVALVVDHPEGLGLIHCYASDGHVIQHRLDDAGLKLIYGVYRP